MAQEGVEKEDDVVRRLVDRNAAHGSVGFQANGKTMDRAATHKDPPRRDES